jgi:hypothetical protein
VKAGYGLAAKELGPDGLLALAAEFWDRAERTSDAAVRSDWLVLAAYHEKLAYRVDRTVRVDH